MIYPNGIPVATCVLLFRCGYAAEQSRKLTRRLLAASDPIRDNESLEEFAQHGEDRLGMTAQLRSWRDTQRPLDVALVRYETLRELLPQVFGSVFSSASLRLYGRYGYFFYIFEVMLISTVFGWMIHGAWSARTPSNLVEVVLAFVLPLPFAWLLWRFIEAPLLQIGHRFAYA